MKKNEKNEKNEKIGGGLLNGPISYLYLIIIIIAFILIMYWLSILIGSYIGVVIIALLLPIILYQLRETRFSL
jgi:Flp pilus assembly protein TadB